MNAEAQTMAPHQLKEEGEAAYQQEAYGEAARAFEAAERGYAASGDLLSAAEMANNRSVALLQAGDAQAALEAVGPTPEILEKAGDTRRYAMALGNKAAALAELGNKVEAEKLYWDTARILEEIGESGLRASVLQAISRLQMRSGKYMEAVASMQSGLGQVEKPNLVQRLLKRLLQIPRMLNR